MGVAGNQGSFGGCIQNQNCSAWSSIIGARGSGICMYPLRGPCIHLVISCNNASPEHIFILSPHSSYTCDLGIVHAQTLF